MSTVTGKVSQNSSQSNSSHHPPSPTRPPRRKCSPANPSSAPHSNGSHVSVVQRKTPPHPSALPTGAAAPSSASAPGRVSPHSSFVRASDAATTVRSLPIPHGGVPAAAAAAAAAVPSVPVVGFRRGVSIDDIRSPPPQHSGRAAEHVRLPQHIRSNESVLAAAASLLVPVHYLDDPIAFRREMRRKNIDRRFAEAVRNVVGDKSVGPGANVPRDIDSSGRDGRSNGKKDMLGGNRHGRSDGPRRGAPVEKISWVDKTREASDSSRTGKKSVGAEEGDASGNIGASADVCLLPPSYLLRWIQWAEHTGAYGYIRKRHDHIMQQYNRRKDEAEQHLLKQRQEAEALAAKQGLDESLDEALLTGLVDGLCLDWRTRDGPNYQQVTSSPVEAAERVQSPGPGSAAHDGMGSFAPLQSPQFYYDPAPDTESLHAAHVVAYQIKNHLDRARFYHGLPPSNAPPIPAPKPLSSYYAPLPTASGAVMLGRTTSLPSPAAAQDAAARLVLPGGVVGGPTATSPRSSAGGLDGRDVGSPLGSKPPMLPLFATTTSKDEPLPPGPIDASSLLEVGVMTHSVTTREPVLEGKRRPPRDTGKAMSYVASVPNMHAEKMRRGSVRQPPKSSSEVDGASPSTPPNQSASSALPLLLRLNLTLISDFSHRRVADIEDDRSFASSAPSGTDSLPGKHPLRPVVAAPAVSSLGNIASLMIGLGRSEDSVADTVGAGWDVDWPFHRDRGVCAVPAKFYDLLRSTQGVLCTDGMGVSFQDNNEAIDGMEVYIADVGATFGAGGATAAAMSDSYYSDGELSPQPHRRATPGSPRRRQFQSQPQRGRRPSNGRSGSNASGCPSTAPVRSSPTMGTVRGRPIEFRRKVTCCPDGTHAVDIYPLKIHFEVEEPDGGAGTVAAFASQTVSLHSPPSTHANNAWVASPSRCQSGPAKIPDTLSPAVSVRQRRGFILVPSCTKVTDSIALLTREVAPGKSSEHVRIWYRSDIRRRDKVTGATKDGDGWEILTMEQRIVDLGGIWSSEPPSIVPVKGNGLGRTGGASPDHIQLLVEIRSSPMSPWLREAYELKNRIQVGDFVDAQDSLGIWCEAVVREVQERTVKVHYFGWSSRWDSVVRRDHRPCFHSEVLSRVEPPAPLWSRTRNWREVIRVGDEVEVREVNSTVQRPRWFKGVVRAVGKPDDPARKIICGAPLETLEEDEEGKLHDSLLLHKSQQVLIEVPQEKAKVSVSAADSLEEPLVPQHSFRRWINLYGQEICEAYTHNKRKVPNTGPATVQYAHPPDRKRVEIMKCKTNGFGEGYVRESLRGNPPAPGSVGLHNLGNTCYMNSILQCMNHIDPLTQYFRNGLYHKDLNKRNPLGSGGRVALSYANLLSDIWGGDYTAIAPRAIKQTISQFAPQFANLLQHDSQEFCSFLMDGIHEDLNRVKEKPYVEDVEARGRSDDLIACETWRKHLLRHDSVIVDKCQGMHRSHLVCPQCQKESIKFDVYSTISLPVEVKTNVKDPTIPLFACIDRFTSPEVLDEKNLWYCPDCKEHVRARKHITLWSTPDILILHIKRFTYNSVGTRGRLRRSKLVCPVDFPIEGLDLSKYVMGPQYADSPPIYTLFGVSEHCGSTATSGHYTATVRNSADGKWYWYNDSHVGNSTGEAAVNGGAYVLFYSRTKGHKRWGGLEEYMKREGINPKGPIDEGPKVDKDGFEVVSKNKRKKNKKPH